MTRPSVFPHCISLFACALFLAAAGLLAGGAALRAAPQQPQNPEIMPLSQVKPGMKGVAYTIFAGNQIEPIDLEVIGILPNLLGPKEDVILVELKSAKAVHTGVVAGMSGSPVYIDGKLVGALSLKFGAFVKEPLAGVTPIEEMLEVRPEPAKAGTLPISDASVAANEDEQTTAGAPAPKEYPLPAEWTQRLGAGSGAALVPIETPVIFSGVKPEVFNRYAGQLSAYGMVAAPGGTAPPQSDDAQIKPGDMVGAVLVNGDLSLTASCTVTLITADRVYVCGHPLFNLGTVEIPMVRGRVLTTLVSDLDSTKIVNAGGVIGTVTQDRTTATLGRLGRGRR